MKEISTLTYPIDHELTAKGYKNLGWRNFWKESTTPAEYGDCYHLAHDTNEMSNSVRGSDHTIWCDICRYFYKLDTSD